MDPRVIQVHNEQRKTSKHLSRAMWLVVRQCFLLHALSISARQEHHKLTTSDQSAQQLETGAAALVRGLIWARKPQRVTCRTS
eukprot:5334677-Amphidinium_carterae.1